MILYWYLNNASGCSINKYRYYQPGPSPCSRIIENVLSYLHDRIDILLCYHLVYHQFFRGCQTLSSLKAPRIVIMKTCAATFGIMNTFQICIVKRDPGVFRMLMLLSMSNHNDAWMGKCLPAQYRLRKCSSHLCNSIVDSHEILDSWKAYAKTAFVVNTNSPYPCTTETDLDLKCQCW